MNPYSFLDGVDACIEVLNTNSFLYSKEAHIASLQKLKTKYLNQEIKNKLKLPKKNNCKHNLVRTTKNYKPAWKCVECGIIKKKKAKA